jgi:predicted GIY-YIG superfamily endonuclease
VSSAVVGFGGGCFVYVIRCKGDKYYVGSTCDLCRRLKQHFSGRGARFCRVFGAEEIVYVERVPAFRLLVRERELTLEYMRKFGWYNVCGYAWCEICKPTWWAV